MSFQSIYNHGLVALSMSSCTGVQLLVPKAKGCAKKWPMLFWLALSKRKKQASPEHTRAIKYPSNVCFSPGYTGRPLFLYCQRILRVAQASASCIQWRLYDTYLSGRYVNSFLRCNGLTISDVGDHMVSRSPIHTSNVSIRTDLNFAHKLKRGS